MKKNDGFMLLHIIFLLVVVAALIATAVYAAHRHTTNQHIQNDNYFESLLQTTENYYSDQTKALGIQTPADSLTKSCQSIHKTESLTDKAQLECFISITKKVTLDQDTGYIGNLFSALDKTVVAEGLGGDTSAYKPMKGSFVYNNSKQGLCVVRVTYSAATSVLDYNMGCSHGASHVPADFAYNPYE